MGLVEEETQMEDISGTRPVRSRDLFGVQLEVSNFVKLHFKYK